MSGIKVENVKLRVDRFVFLEGHGINVLAEQLLFLIAEIAPICALQACVEGFQFANFREVVGDIGIFVTRTGNINIITLDMMKKMKSNVFLGTIGLSNNEIDMAGFEGLSGIKVENMKLRVDRFVFPEGHGINVLASEQL
eukprot:10621746-Karenia_brevis.AAC.1